MVKPYTPGGTAWVSQIPDFSQGRRDRRLPQEGHHFDRSNASDSCRKFFKEKFADARDNSLTQISGAHCHYPVPVCQAQREPPNVPDIPGICPGARGQRQAEFLDSYNLVYGQLFGKVSGYCGHFKGFTCQPFRWPKPLPFSCLGSETASRIQERVEFKTFKGSV